MPEGSDEAERVRLMTLEMIRGQTQIVRNWGYPSHMRRIVEDLFAPFSSEIRERVGSDVHGIAEAFAQLVGAAEARLNDFKRRYGPAIRESDGTKAIEKFVRTLAAGRDEMRMAMTAEAERLGVPSEATGAWLEEYIRSRDARRLHILER